MTTGETIGAIALGMNLLVVVWGAAKIDSTVSNLVSVVGELKELVASISNITHGLIARVAVLEDRVGIRKLEDV